MRLRLGPEPTLGCGTWKSEPDAGPDEVRASFSHDPRVPEHAAPRAADADRDTVVQALTEAYADGRLDRVEFDERTASTMGPAPWVIWAVTMFGGFPWPVFVMLGTGMNALNTHLNREDTLVRERKRLEKRQRKELERRPPGDEQSEEEQ